MIFINTFVHVFEALAGMLVLLTFFQVHRCYRAYYKTAQSPNIPSPELDSVRPVFETNERRNIKASTKPKIQADVSLSASSVILNDYIGEFFTDSSSELLVDIQAYKVSEKVLGHSDNVSAKSKEPKTDEIIKVETLVPVLPGVETVISKTSSNVVSIDDRVDIVELVHTNLEDDDSIIIVASGVAKCSASQENIMSDKVVHAMLDEAKLVCVS